jgi:hypothetical protein
LPLQLLAHIGEPIRPSIQIDDEAQQACEPGPMSETAFDTGLIKRPSPTVQSRLCDAGHLGGDWQRSSRPATLPRSFG